MGTSLDLHGACPPPFLQLSYFKSKAGFLEGRYCAPVPSMNITIDCCLPCPISDWVYSKEFEIIPKAASWLNVAGMVCSISLLLSYLVLPIQRTSRHYLTVGMVIAVCLMQLGFIIPLAVQPEQCHDAITPNDMHTDLTCAFSGAFLLFGGFAGTFWAFLRSLSIHLQICWQVVPGKKYFWCSIIAGWGVPAIILGILIPVTGVSYRFGDTCHINHHKALQDYWGPLLAFATVSTVLQFITFGYCIRVYIRALLNDSTVNSQSQVSSGGLPSYSSRSGSIKTLTPGQAYRRVKKVIALQWRGTIIVLIIIIDVLFLAICFVQMDNTVSAAMRNFEKARPWLLCLALNQGNKDACLDQVREAKLVTKEATVIALLFLLSLNGIWCLLFLGRTSMVLGWYDLLRRPFQKEQPEFVSADARRFSAISGAPSSTRQYEMITSPSFRPPSMPSSLASVPLKAADTNVSTITTPPLYENGGLSPLPQSPRSPSSVYPDSDYFAKETSVRDSSNTFGQDAQYRSPKLSFSTPRPPSAGRSFSRDSSLSRPYSQTRETLPQRSFSPPQNPAGAGSRNLKPFSPPPIFASNSNRGESRGRSHSPIVEWDPTSTYAAGSGPRLGPGSEPGSGSGGVRPDGLGRIIDKDEGF